MSDAFAYRPKFVDIRASKKGAKAAPGAKAPEAVERPCDHVGCVRHGAHRAPKGRERVNEYWYFCLDHVTEYNRRWNYFSGMSDAELAEFQAKAEVGHRPTWTFKAGRGDRMSAATRGMKAGQVGDGFNLFGSAEPVAAARPRKRLSRLQALALEALSLEEGADGAQIRARYAELVKMWHPDSNAGDRSAEANLQRAVQAYHVLKAGGLV
jgi:hypothetical protein